MGGQWDRTSVTIGGHQNCPLMASGTAKRFSWSVASLLCLGCLGEADRVAVGDDDVGVVQEPVDGGVGDRLRHQFVEVGISLWAGRGL